MRSARPASRPASWCITGAGRAFCSGQDLGDRATAAERQSRADAARRIRADAQGDLRLPGPHDRRGERRGGRGRGEPCPGRGRGDRSRERRSFSRPSPASGSSRTPAGPTGFPRQVGFARAMGAALFAEPVTARRGRRLGHDLGSRRRMPSSTRCGDVVALEVAEIELAGAADLELGIGELFLPLAHPAHGARDREDGREHRGREAHRVEDDAGIEIDVGIELALDEVVVLRARCVPAPWPPAAAGCC
jgi:hypothetical protein